MAINFDLNVGERRCNVQLQKLLGRGSGSLVYGADMSVSSGAATQVCNAHAAAGSSDGAEHFGFVYLHLVASACSHVQCHSALNG